MDIQREMLKQALYGPKASGPHFVMKIAKCCAEEIALHPERDPSSVVAGKAVQTQLNKKQVSRLVEETNKMLVQPILKSDVKMQKNKVALKSKVQDMVQGAGKDGPVGQVSGQMKNDANGPDFKNKGQSERGFEKKARLALYGLYQEDDYGINDYTSPPQSVPYIEKEAYAKQEKPSMKELMKTAAYIAKGIKEKESELYVKQREMEYLASDFCKLASQCVNSDKDFTKLMNASLRQSPHQETLDMLKIAATYLNRRHKVSDASEWHEAIECLYNAPGSLEKISSLAVAVDPSLISKDLEGRVRFINGDHVILKKLKQIDENRQSQHESKMFISRLKDRKRCNDTIFMTAHEA